MDRSALEFVAAHCDIRERLADLPADARVRGVAFRSITAALADAGGLPAFEQRFGNPSHDSIGFYPLGDYLLHMASCAAVLYSPERVYEGMAQICRSNARHVSTSLLGKALIHALASDPLSLLEQGLAMRRQMLDYGRWELVHHGPRDLEVRYFDEYVWIEQAHAHAAAGTFDACSIKPTITTRLSGPYSGSSRFVW